MAMSVRLVGSWSGSFGSGGGTASVPAGGTGIPVGDVIIASGLVASGSVSAYSDDQGNTWELKGDFWYCRVTTALASTDDIIATISRFGGGTTPGRGSIAHIENPSWDGEPDLVLSSSISATEDQVVIPTAEEWLIMSWQSDVHGTQVGDQIDVAPIASNFTELASGETTGVWDVGFRFGYRIQTAAATVSFIADDTGMPDGEGENDITILTGFGPSAARAGWGIVV